MDYDKFSEIFLPAAMIPEFLPGSWKNTFHNGFVGSSVNAGTSQVAFPKRQFFPTSTTPKECRYAEEGVITACRWLGGSLINTYHSETMTFLQGIGLYSLQYSNSTGTTDRTHGDIKLMQRIVGSDTSVFSGTLTFSPIGIRHTPRSTGSVALPSATKFFDAAGRLLPLSTAPDYFPKFQEVPNLPMGE
jgi:hypothetical protein